MPITKKTNLSAYVKQLRPSWLGKFFYYCLPIRKRIVLKNMRRAFGDELTASEITRLAQAFYSHFVKSLAENMLMRMQSLDRIRQSTEIIGYKKVMQATEQNKGVILLTGHFGNWELAPIGGILQFTEFQGRFHCVRKSLRIKWLERWLFRRYYRAGLNVIPSKNSLDQVVDALGANDAIIFVMDQHASINQKDGIAVEFFGTKAGTYRSLASIVRYTEVPVIPTAVYRRPDGKHVLEFGDPIPWCDAGSLQETLYQNTRAYNRALEQIIRAHPDQWWWLHKRWKLSS